MNKIGTQALETERLLLRRFTPEDAPAMYENWCKDPLVSKYLRFTAYQSVDDAVQTLSQWVPQYEKDPMFLHWCIALKDGTAIGSLGLMDAAENDQSAEIGYCIGREWWGAGYVTEALKAVFQYAFEKVELNRLEACHSINNQASGRVMQKAGMTLYGHPRQKYICILGPQDCDAYEILRSDWLANHT